MNRNPMLEDGSTKSIGVCPHCKSNLLYEPYTKFCRWCGYKLNWEDGYDNPVGIIMIGAPCSGKSTIGKLIASNTGIRYISSGDLARSMGDDVNRQLDIGGLAPENRMREMVSNEISKYNHFVLDGFPRFNEQYKYLKRICGHRLLFVNIGAPIEELRRRIYNDDRRHIRNDDTYDTFIKRYEFYINKTLPMINNIIMDNDVMCLYHNNSCGAKTNEIVQDIVCQYHHMRNNK